MRKTGILFISPAVNIFGAEGRLLDLIDGLDKETFHPVVLLPGHGPLEERLLEMKVTTVIYPFRCLARFHWIRFILITRFFIRLVKEKNIAVVHNNMHYFTNNFWLGYFLTRVAVITHIRTPLWTHLFERWVMSKQFRIICVSQAVKNIFCEKRRSDAFIHFRPEQVEAIYNGHNLTRFSVSEDRSFREEFKLSDDEKIIILLGAIDPVKGQDLLIEAAHQIKAKHPRIKCFIIGELYKQTPEKQAYFQKLKDMIRDYGLESDVIFTGYREDVPQILHSADILVQPSAHEALGGCMIQAMASGVPVVGTPVHGSPEIIGDNEAGIVMKHTSSDALAEALLFLLDHPDIARQKGKNGRARAERLFEIRTNNQKIYDLYAQAAQETGKDRHK
jgi:glycosyltransferase involved in cell wall biosynthesis